MNLKLMSALIGLTSLVSASAFAKPVTMPAIFSCSGTDSGVSMTFDVYVDASNAEAAVQPDGSATLDGVVVVKGGEFNAAATGIQVEIKPYDNNTKMMATV